MKKKIMFILFSFMFLFAKVDFSAMSTQELLAMIGYVQKSEQRAFDNELKKRVPNMSSKEKKIYEQKTKK